MSRKMEKRHVNEKDYPVILGVEEMDNDFIIFVLPKQWNCIENQLQDLVVAVKRMKQSIERRNKLKCKKNLRKLISLKVLLILGKKLMMTLIKILKISINLKVSTLLKIH